MQCLPILLVLALWSPVATLDILAKSKQGSNTSTKLAPPDHKPLRRLGRAVHGHHAQQDHHAQQEAHHAQVRMVNNAVKGHHKKEVSKADSVETVAEDYALSIDFCTRWRLREETRAMCSRYMRRRCQQQPAHEREAGLCATYLLGASKSKEEAVGEEAAGEEAAGEDAAREEAGLDVEKSSGKRRKTESELSDPLPEQGYSGPLVEHEDMETRTKDWRKEYGPRSKHPRRTFENVCRQYPESEWCRHNGYLPVYGEEREQQDEQEEDQEQQEPQQAEEPEEEKGDSIQETLDEQFKKVKIDVDGVKSSAAGQQAVLTSLLVLGASLVSL